MGIVVLVLLSETDGRAKVFDALDLSSKAEQFVYIRVLNRRRSKLTREEMF